MRVLIEIDNSNDPERSYPGDGNWNASKVAQGSSGAQYPASHTPSDVPKYSVCPSE